MNRLETKIFGMRLNPFYGNAAADYTRVLGIGNEITDYEIFSKLQKQGLLGFKTTKTFTAEKREGNPEPRFAWIERYQGLQSMGLPNVGIYNFPFEKCNATTIISYVGRSREEAKEMTLYLNEKAKKNPKEYNVACPNVPGCPSYYKEDSLEHLKVVRENTDSPLIAKIGYLPEEEKLIEFGRKVEDIGIDGITAINSPPGMGIDIDAKRAVTAKKYAGVFGSGLKPLALRAVNILHENTNLCIIGLGGIYKFSDALEFRFAGADAVELCSTLIGEVYPRDNETRCSKNLVESRLKGFLKEFRADAESFMERKGYKSLSEIKLE